MDHTVSMAEDGIPRATSERWIKMHRTDVQNVTYQLKIVYVSVHLFLAQVFESLFWGMCYISTQQPVKQPALNGSFVNLSIQDEELHMAYDIHMTYDIWQVIWHHQPTQLQNTANEDGFFQRFVDLLICSNHF